MEPDLANRSRYRTETLELAIIHEQQEPELLRTGTAMNRNRCEQHTRTEFLNKWFEYFKYQRIVFENNPPTLSAVKAYRIPCAT